MMISNQTRTTVAVIAILAAIVLTVFSDKIAPLIKGISNDMIDSGQSSGRGMSLKDYLNQNISILSPVKASLGGKFYVTKAEAHGGAGAVHYEDGHNAYVADFTYSVDERGAMSIETFTLRR